MNLRELFEVVRERMDDDQEPYLNSDKTLVLHFNQAVVEAAIRAFLIYDETTATGDGAALCTLSVTSGDRVYPLHPKILAVQSATLASSGFMLVRDPHLPQIDHHHPMWRTVEGTPTAFATFRESLYLNHTPTEDDTVYLRVYRLPLDSEKMRVGTDVPPIPHQFHHGLSHWVLYRLFNRKDADFYRPEDAEDELKRFEALFGKAPSAKVMNSIRDNPHASMVHARPFGGTTGRATWFGHRY